MFTKEDKYLIRHYTLATLLEMQAWVRGLLENNSLLTQKFEKKNLKTLIWTFIQPVGGDLQTISSSEQLKYLYRYLKKLRTLLKSKALYFVAEPDYIDRDFIDDFARFYSKCMRNYPKKCLRVHFFDDEITDELIACALEDVCASSSNKGKYEELQKHYLGCVVFRPLARAFVGKTVLKVYPFRDGQYLERHYTCTKEYKVSLVGIPLTIEGLAFQQQDATVGACATTAIWCALHKAAPDAESYVPTPSQITESATRYNLAGGRAFPSGGLTMAQICEAIRAFGLEPEFMPIDGEDKLKAILHTYLSSYIPVIAAIYPYEVDESSYPDGKIHYRHTYDSGSGHAITFVGYKRDKSIDRKIYLPFLDTEEEDVITNKPSCGPKEIEEIARKTPKEKGAWFEWRAMDELYAHDDRFGPYVRVRFPDSKFLETHSLPDRTLGNIIISWDYNSAAIEPALVRYLIVPVYPKLRLNWKNIFEEAGDRLKDLDRILTHPREIIPKFPIGRVVLPTLEFLNIKFFFIRGKEYLFLLQKQFTKEGFPPSEIFRMSEFIRLPRQVGVCQVDRIDNVINSERKLKPFLDILFDTTESHLGKYIQGVVLKDPRLEALFDVIPLAFRIPSESVFTPF